MKYLYILIFLCFLLTIYFFYNIFFNSKYFYNKHIRHNYRAICKPDHNYYNCKKLKNNYKIKIFNNFLTDKECSFFINYGKNKLEYSNQKSLFAGYIEKNQEMMSIVVVIEDVDESSKSIAKIISKNIFDYYLSEYLIEEKVD